MATEPNADKNSNSKPHKSSKSVSQKKTPAANSKSGKGSAKKEAAQLLAALKKKYPDKSPDELKIQLKKLLAKRKEKGIDSSHPSNYESVDSTASTPQKTDAQSSQKEDEEKAGIFTQKREPRTEIISKIFYKQAHQKLFKQYFLHIFFLLIIFLFAGYSIYGFANYRITESKIMNSATLGLEALGNDQLDKARSLFDQTLSMYRYLSTKYSPLFWRPTGQIYALMLRTAQGWRSLGNYPKALETFHYICMNLNYDPDLSLKSMLEENLIEFIDESHWGEETMSEIYHYLLQQDPSVWGELGEFHVQTTERAGLVAVPIRERYQKADVVVYGTPQIETESTEKIFSVDGIIFYKIDRVQGKIIFDYPALSETHQKHLDWYLKKNDPCLIFGQNVDEEGKKATLNSIHGILSSESYVVDDFNSLIQQQSNSIN